MWCIRRTTCLWLVLSSGAVSAEGYILGVGAEGDSADGRAISAFADFGLSDNAWISLTGGAAETKGVIRDNETALAEASFDYWLKPLGFRVGGGYWGSSDILDSRDIKASLYVRGDAGSLSVDYQKRNFQFDLQSDLLRGRPTVGARQRAWRWANRSACSQAACATTIRETCAFSRTLTSWHSSPVRVSA